MNKIYTFERWENGACVSKIEDLSYDAAIEIAKATSIVGRCTISTPHGKDRFGDLFAIKAFVNGRMVSEYIAGED